MKKRTLLLILIFPLFLSCNNDKIQKLNSQINELENQNAELKKALQKDKIEKLTSSYFTIKADEEHLTVNREGIIKISLVTIDTIPEFDVYSIDQSGNRTLVMEKLNRTEFNYSFTPTSKEDNKIELEAKFELPTGEIIMFPILGKVNVKE